MDKTGQHTTFDSSVQVSPQSVTGPTRGFETPSSSSSSSGGTTSRYPRYSTQPPVARSYPRSPPSTPARSTPRHITATPRFDFPNDYRPYRSFEEISLEGEGETLTVTVGQGPQELRHLQKERVALLEQLEDCASSGEEGGSRRRCKHRRSHSGEGSRPGTPLCDERPENLPPVEPRRTPRERPPDPLSLPLPRFATQLLSPRPTPPSPPASPPRPQSTSSDDSEPSPPSPEWEERLRSLDEKYEKWSGSRTLMNKVDATSLKVRHKLLDLDLHELQPSDIVKSVLAKRSVFDEDSKRLENFGEKYEPREFVPMRCGFTTFRPRLGSPTLHSPNASAAASPGGAKGLQYPFPSHPPVQPTTSVATTTAAMSVASCSSLSSPITILSPNISVDSIPATCVSSVPSRQFPAPPSPFHLTPKISPTTLQEKKTDCNEPLSRFNCIDKTKSLQTLPQPNLLIVEKLEVVKKESIATPPLISKPLKSCLRRESGDDKKEVDGRRKSREEEAKVSSIFKDCDKPAEPGVIERRRSLSDPRRRNSVDLTKDSLHSDSVSDKPIEKLYKEESRRRDSVDNRVEKDAELSRVSDRLSEQTDISETYKHTDTLNLSLDPRHVDNQRHASPTDTLEKKKDSLQICPERNRRRGRDSTDSSDSLKHKKVPECLVVKKESESDVRHRDGTGKSDNSCKTSLDFIERRKSSGHKHNYVLEIKSEDCGCASRDSIKHKERRESTSIKKEKYTGELLDNTRHKSLRKSPELAERTGYKDEKHKSFLEGSKSRENSLQKDLVEEHPYKNTDIKRETGSLQNLNETNLFQSFNSSVELGEMRDNTKKDIKKESDSSLNFTHRDSNRHNECSRSKDTTKKKECIVYSAFGEHGEVKQDSDVYKIKSQDLKEETETEKHFRPSNYEHSRLQHYGRTKEGDNQDPRLKTIERSFQNDVISNKQIHSNSQLDVERTNKISEWVEEIRKDMENSNYTQNNSEQEFDRSISDSNKNQLHSNEMYVNKKKEDYNFDHKDDIKKEEFEAPHKENERSKHECRFYEGKKLCDTAEIFRRKEIAHKKEEDLEYKLKENNKRRDHDLVENSKHRFTKDVSEKDRNKGRNTTDLPVNSYRQKEWLENKISDKKTQIEKHRKNSRDSTEKDVCESITNISRKDGIEGFERKLNDSCNHDVENIRSNDCLNKDKKKERLHSWPAVLGNKRRLSSQDIDIFGDDSKKIKPERRDSKDSGRCINSSKKSSYEKHKFFTKLLEDKIKEDKEREMTKMRKDEELCFETMKSLSKRDKKGITDKKKVVEGSERQNKARPKENGVTASESEAGSCDEDSKTPKRHSIFDIVDEEPAYISMYDKVKARSTKNMQKQEEEKRQERLKEKFNQLKQSRAKREEKKRSTSYDEDSDSERGGRRSNKLLITSSEEDACSENDTRTTRSRKIMSDTSEDDTNRHNSNLLSSRASRITDEIESKQRKFMSDTSEDDMRRLSINRMKTGHSHQDLEPKLRKILSDTSEDDIMKHSVVRNKSTRIQSDESEIDMGEDQKKDYRFIKKTNDYVTSDLFSNISEDPEHPSHTDIEKEHAEIDTYQRHCIGSNICDLPRKKSHKKKQKRQKNIESPDDCMSKRHNSKKDRRKSSHSHDGEDQLGQTKVRKKKSESSKRDEKMEDIFGPLSDDSDKANNTWNAPKVYGSDTDDERQRGNVIRKRDKKRKERKFREPNEEVRHVDSKLFNDSESFPSEELTKAKKKKRKKSRDEKINKHQLQRLEESGRANEADSEREPEQVTPQPLPRLIDSPPPRLIDSPTPCINLNKKPDIPGFGSQVDENIHETAVKSISESSTNQVKDKREPIEEAIPSSNSEDKPTPVISQEETEDAVAALLMEDSFGGGFESYTKPDTPVSEPDLQIDTDTEDNYDPIDFSKPPRTPDIPTSFYKQQDTREGLEERILALACTDNSANNEVSSASKLSLSEHSKLQQHEQKDSGNPSTSTENDNRTLLNSDTNKDLNVASVSCEKSKEEPEATTAVVEEGRKLCVSLESQSDSSQPDNPSTNKNSELTTKINEDKGIHKDPNSNLPEMPSLSHPVQTNPPSPPPSSVTQSANNLGQQAGTSASLTLSTSQKECNKSNPVPMQITKNTLCSSVKQMEQNNAATLSLPSLSESDLIKPLSPKPTNQIVVRPPSSVAFILQPHTKIKQPAQHNNSILQMSSKVHTPASPQLETKGNLQYVFQHTLPPVQGLGSSTVINKIGNQQVPPISQGPNVQGNNKLIVSSSIVSLSKPPAVPVSTKSPGQSFGQSHQMVLNYPHNQQLSVNVTHNHQISGNSNVSPNHTVNSGSPNSLNFSSHHVKVSVSQQHQSNNIHPRVLHSPNIQQQHSPSLHRQQSPNLSPTQQLSPNVHQQQSPNKKNHQEQPSPDTLHKPLSPNVQNQTQSSNFHHQQKQSPNLHHQQQQSLNLNHQQQQSPNLHHQQQQSPNLHNQQQQSPSVHHQQQQSPNLHQQQQQSPKLNYQQQQSPNVNYQQQQSPNLHHQQQQSPNVQQNQQQSPNRHNQQQQDLNFQHQQQPIPNLHHQQQQSPNLHRQQQQQSSNLQSPQQQQSPYAHHQPQSPHLYHQQQGSNLHPQTQQNTNLHFQQQLSPKIHHQQQIGIHQQQVHPQKISQQQSQVSHHMTNAHQNKSNGPVHQQFSNCIGTLPSKLCSPPLKPGSVPIARHLTPVSQPPNSNKITSHIIQAGVQQVRAVLVQNPVKQVITVLQPQAMQRTFVPPTLRLPNAQPGVVHNLKGDPLLLDKCRNMAECTQPSQASDLSASKHLQQPEEPIALTTSKGENEPLLCKLEKINEKENKLSSVNILNVEKPTKPPSDERKPTSAVIQENKVYPAQICQDQIIPSTVASDTKAITVVIQENKTDSVPKINFESRLSKSSVEEIKPLNAVIKDLTFKAAQAKLTVTSSISDKLEESTSSCSKPLDQVVQEIHDRKKAAEPKELAKSDNTISTKLENVNDTSKVEAKAESEINKEILKDQTSQNMEANETKPLENESKKISEELKQEKDLVLPKSELTETAVTIVLEPRVEKIRIKKEENGLCVDSIPTQPTHDDHPTIPTDLKAELTGGPSISELTNTKSESDSSENKTDQDGGVISKGVPPVMGRGRGRRRKASSHVGGVVTRRSRLNNSASSGNDMASADVYEFRDDSEEEANRPRLILTIKSPHDAAVSSQASSNCTRKSRRLQEKDGVRSTVDDTIEDVIRGTRSCRRTTRASTTLETRKSPRRKQSAAPTPAVPTTESEGETSEPTPPPPTSPQPAAIPPPQPSTEPMTLIDPVTGLLIPMQESEEGQYIPVNSDTVRTLPEDSKDCEEPSEKRLRTSVPESGLPTRPGLPTKVPPNCAVVPPLPPIPQAKTTGIPRPITTPVALTKPLAIATPAALVKGVVMSPTAVSKASLTNVVGPMTINRVAAPSPVSPSANPALNLKAQLLQRGKPSPLTPKAHIIQSINAVGREAMVGSGTVLTGSVASPPLRAPHLASQQPAVTGARVKVDQSGCLVMPTTTPQSRGQVMQAGLPVPAYEASLGDVVQHVKYAPHPAHYVHPQMVYQQYLREAALSGAYHLPTSNLAKVDLEEGAAASPPLELRRGSPHDRATDSPQVATVYMHGGPRHLYYQDPPVPPPAHRPVQPRLQVSTPPLASQVPPMADSLHTLLQRYPVMWQGLLALKTDQAAVQMHFVFGNPNLARDSLPPCNSDGCTPPLRIAQRMRLEPTQVEGVSRKMQSGNNEHCMLLALPCGRDHMDVLQQSNNLQSGFITYLQQKQAAGIINIAAPGSHQAAYVVHIFPSCDFANDNLQRKAPDLHNRVANIAHLLIVIATVA